MKKEPSNHMRKLPKSQSLLCDGMPLFTLFLILMLASCSILPSSLQQKGQNDLQSAAVTVPVTRGDISSSISFVGNLEYNQSATLAWKTGGVIESVSVKVGDQVKKGDILAVLETESLSSPIILAEKTMIEQQEKLEDVVLSETARMKAYANLNAKESALKQAKLKQEALYYPRATRQDMELAWDSLALANLNFNYAKQDYDALVARNDPWEGYEPPVTVYRFGRMITYGGDDRSGRQRKFEEYVSTYNSLVDAYENYQWVIGQPSATDYAIAEGNVQVAQIEYDKALEEYLSYENLPREKDVNAAQIALNNAEASFEQRYIIAQFDGTVTSVSAVEGYYVAKGSSAIRLDDMSRIYIPISIPELDISSVKNGTIVSITVDAIPGKTYTGHIRIIAEASASGGSTTSFSALIEVDDPDERMLAGMTAEVSMPLNAKSDVLLIPNSAISYNDGKTTVTVQNDETTQTVEVRLGIVTDNLSEVISGNLSEGSLLVVSRDTAIGSDVSRGAAGNRQ